MRNFVAYFYNISIDKMIFNRNYYSFNYGNNLYRLYLVEDEININMIVEINQRLLRYTLISEIIINRDSKYVSNYNGKKYMLIKIYANPNKKISLEEITYLANTLYSEKNKTDWATLWGNKIDYLEKLINENGKKYPLLVDSFNYFVGMAENAISYYNDIPNKSGKFVISHKSLRFNDTTEALYNPLNIIFDYPARDVAEYIKNSFFNNNRNIWIELDNYMKQNNLADTDAKLIISRILYPSFYFEMYEDILIYGQNEKEIIKITDKLKEYEKYLAKIITFFKQYFNIMEINWLNNKNED